MAGGFSGSLLSCLFAPPSPGSRPSIGIGLIFQNVEFYFPKYIQDKGLIGAINWGDMKASMDLFLMQYEPGYFPNH